MCIIIIQHDMRGERERERACAFYEAAQETSCLKRKWELCQEQVERTHFLEQCRKY